MVCFHFNGSGYCLLYCITFFSLACVVRQSFSTSPAKKLKIATCGSCCHFHSSTSIVLHPRTRLNWPYFALLMFACKLYT
uniref:Secreted protein n=1 Tax=Pyxicephalus adspersus TaxID=30357 RepID=A0AAV3ADU1_PYXAD|nr:TPA: hypothetical protein GDO54_017865 [Pyxicephalus adspersus]